IIHKHELDPSFRNSYTTLWEKFDAVEIDDHVFVLKVPLNVRALELVSRDHRRRARARRRNWDEIVESTRLSLAKYRTLPGPDQPYDAAACTEPLSAPAG